MNEPLTVSDDGTIDVFVKSNVGKMIERYGGKHLLTISLTMVTENTLDSSIKLTNDIESVIAMLQSLSVKSVTDVSVMACTPQ